jgi:2-keto-3-deoxy-L-rhamnonate aldolase RhmA
MSKLPLTIVLTAVIAMAVFAAQAPTAPAADTPQAQGQAPGRGQADAQGRGPTTPGRAGADPYANNTTVTTFPLAAPAGKDSNARNVAPMGAVNQGAFDPANWKYGTAFNAPPGSKIWNPVKLKLMAGGKVTGGTLFSATDPATYCAMANAGYDFIWTEMQHDQRDWETASKMWRTCPTAKAVPGVRVAYTDERRSSTRSMPARLSSSCRPWIPWKKRSKHATGRTSRRSAVAATAADRRSTRACGAGVPGGYRNTINDNIVLVLMIETLEGLKNADAIAKVPGVSALFAASGDLGNFSGYRQGSPDYERAINIVHDATLKAGIRLCGPIAWRDRPDFTCFQAGSETAAIARGVAAELGPLANTQGKPEVGPFAK